MATPLVFTPFERGGRMLLDGAIVNPVPVGPTVGDATQLTIAVDLSGPAQQQALAAPSKSLIDDNSYRRRILKFIDTVRPARSAKEPSRGMISTAMASMEIMQDTITRLRMAEYLPDIVIDVPRNACGFFDFWKAEELIELGRERAAIAFARFEAARPGGGRPPG